MADAIAKLRADLEARLPEEWHVEHARPYARPGWLDEQGEYRAHRRLPNGTLIVQHGDTPDDLVRAAAEYDREHDRSVATSPIPVTGVLATPTPTGQPPEPVGPQTEQDLALRAIEVQPVALAEKVAADGSDSVGDVEKAKAGLTAAGAPKKGTDATIIPPDFTPEEQAAVAGVQPKTTKKRKGK